MLSYIALAVVCIILIIVIYYAFVANSDRSKRRRSERFLQESAGIFDDNARRALHELTQIEDPAPGDLFRRGNIVEYNIMEGNVRTRVGESADARRERILAVGTIARDYTDALRGMRRVEYRGNMDDYNPGFMLRRMEDFGQRFDDDDDPMMWQILAGFNDTLTTVGPAVRQDVIENRQQRAAAAAENREEAIDNYFDDAIKFTSDPQNVHDSKVNEDLRKTLRKLRETAPRVDSRAAIAECRKYIQEEYAKDPDNARKVNDALRILDIISRGESIGTFQDNEDRIFAVTWERTKHPRNRRNADLMKEAVVNALADSIERGANVCINGRCGRVLNSLVTLDYDSGVGGAMTYEAYKNQIFQETQNIIKAEIARAKESPDDTMRAVGESYEGANVEVSPEAEEAFKKYVKAEIDRNLDAYEGQLNPQEISQLKQECYAAVDF